MPRWSSSDFIDRKGQFFVISVVIIALSLMSIMTLLRAYGEVGLTDIHAYREDGIFRSVKEGIQNTVLSSGCGYGYYGDQPRKGDLKDFIETAEKDVRRRGMYLNITLDEDGICDPYVDSTVDISLYSQRFEMSETFSLVLEPYFEIYITDHDDQVDVGDNVVVEYTVTNVGDEGDTQDIVFTVENDEGNEIYIEEETNIDLGSEEDYYGDFKWDTSGVDPGEYHLTVSSDDDYETVTASVGDQYTLTVNIEGEGVVEVDGEEVGEGDTKTYYEGTEVGLKAIDTDYWYFIEWTGDYEETEKEITITMDDNKDITAWFEEDFDGWWDQDWGSCRNIDVSDGIDGYQYKLTTDYAGDIDRDSIRIVDAACNEGGSRVSHWTQEWSDEGVLWFKGSGTETEYSLYYDNPDAIDISHGPSTFIAFEDSEIQSHGDHTTSGTLITFTDVSNAMDTHVHYEYCYRAQTTGRTASITTLFDGSSIDYNSFNGPQCPDRDEYASRTFTETSETIDDEIRFDFSNGDWRVQIRNIRVRKYTSPEPTATLSDTVYP